LVVEVPLDSLTWTKWPILQSGKCTMHFLRQTKYAREKLESSGQPRTRLWWTQ